MIDLHLHSTCSDGSETPARVVELAAEAALSALALTDHDGLSGLAEARRRAGELGLGFVPGCEVSCAFSPGAMHVLCYFVEDGEGPLQDELVRLRSDRATRNLRLTAHLRALGYDLTMEEVAARAGGTVVGRPHFAAVLVDKGAASSIKDAFDTILGKGKPGYVAKSRLTATETLAAATGSGALAVLAHPLSLGVGPAELERHVGELVDLGLAGIECYYGRYSPEERAGLAEIAARRGLVATGGSDFHGSFKPDLSVGTGTGDLEVPDSVLERLAERLGRSRVPSAPASRWTTSWTRSPRRRS